MASPRGPDVVAKDQSGYSHAHDLSMFFAPLDLLCLHAE